METLGIKVSTTADFAAEESLDRDVPGRQGWLDRLRVSIVDDDGLLYLSHYDES